MSIVEGEKTFSLFGFKTIFSPSFLFLEKKRIYDALPDIFECLQMTLELGSFKIINPDLETLEFTKFSRPFLKIIPNVRNKCAVINNFLHVRMEINWKAGKTPNLMKNKLNHRRKES